MDFGMVPYDGLTEADFLLPSLPQPHLPGTKNKTPKVFIGLSTWAGEEEKSKRSSHPKPGTLEYYATQFNSIELNATHDALVSPEQIKKWYNLANSKNASFAFCPQFHKYITRQGILGMPKLGISREFIEKVRLFKEKLGTSFIVVPESSNVDQQNIFEYLQAIPNDFELSIEFRNLGWFKDTAVFAAFMEKLNRVNKGVVITDTPGRRDAVHMQLSNTTAFIRFNCLGDHELDLFRIDQWKKQLRSWFWQGLEKCYFFLHIHNEEYIHDFRTYVQHEFRFE